MPAPAQPVEFDNFSGGLTDFFLPGDPTKFLKGDNFLLSDDDKPQLFTRPGSKSFDGGNGVNTDGRLPTGNQRVSKLWYREKDDVLFSSSGQKLFYYDSGWTELLSAASQSAFGAGGAFSVVTWDEWKGQTILTNDGGASPLKIFKDSTTNTFKLTTQGLPAVAEPLNYVYATELSNCITLANDTRTQMLAHFADVTQHTGGADTVASALIEAAATDFDSLATLTTSLNLAHEKHLEDMLRADPDYHDAPLVGSFGTSYADIVHISSYYSLVDTLPNIALFLNDLKLIYNEHETQELPHNSVVGLHQVAATDISELTSGPSLSLSQSELFSFTRDAIEYFNYHADDAISGDNRHLATVGTRTATLPFPITTQDGLFTYLTLLAADYWAHNHDAQETTPSGHSATQLEDHNLSGDDPNIGDGGSDPDLDHSNAICSSFGVRRNDAPNRLSSPALNLLTNFFQQFGGHVKEGATHNDISSDVPPQSLPTGGQFIYSFHYSYSYSINGLEFEDVGPTITRSLENAFITKNSPITISNIPVLSNDSLTRYDTANVKLKIYRTAVNGTTSFLIATLDNGTTSYEDYTLDSELGDGEALYTDSGELDKDPPPHAKYVHILNNTAYYLNFEENGEDYSYRIQQAVPNEPYACPREMFADLDEPGTALGSVRSNVMAFSDTSIYRLEGLFDATGNGLLRAEKITDTIGCIGQNSLVQAESGLYFASNDGFYFTNGFQLQKLPRKSPSSIDDTYASLIQNADQKLRMNGHHDRLNRRIWWHCHKNPYGVDCDFTVIYDIDTDAFTTASNSDYWSPTASAFRNGVLLRGDRRGYLFEHLAQWKSDPLIDTSSNISTWEEKAIVYDYRSCALNYGGIASEKYFTRLNIAAKDIANASIQINTESEDRRTYSMSPIRYRDNLLWGEPGILWGDEDYSVWSYARRLIDEWRRFPSPQLRSDFRQIRITNARVVITGSDERGNVDISGGAGTATADLLSAVWFMPQSCLGYFIAFEDDDYVTEYEIFGTLATSVSFLDPDGDYALGATNKKWVIRGVPKDERLQLISYAVHLAPAGKTQADYDSTGTGENAS